MTADTRDALSKSDYTTAAVIRRALSEAPSLQKGLKLTLFLAMSGQAITVVTPIIIQQIIDRDLLGGGFDFASVAIKASIALAALVVGVVVGRMALLRLVRSASTGLSDLRTKTFDHILRQSVLHVQAERRGNLVSRVTSDITTLQEFMEWGGVGLIIATSQVLLATAVMTFYEWRLAVIVLVGVVLYLFMMRWFQRILSRKYDNVRLEVGRSLGVLSEAITAIPVVRAYGVEEKTKTRVAGALSSRFWAEFRTARFGNILFSTAEVFAALLTASVIGVGIYLGTGGGTMTAGTLVAFLFLVNLLIEPVQVVVETLDFAQSAASGLRRVLGVLDSEIEIEEPDDPESPHAGGLSVRFENVSYSYPDGPEVLSGVTVDIPVGSRVAVVGETGSGKTTFAKLLVRLVDPGGGTIFIGGVPAARIRLAELRRRVAFVPQEGFLFDDTVANNIRYGSPEADDAEIFTAFHELGLGAWVDSLPDGLETVTGERGSNLSAGERQLVALVRAWIASPDLLVLDEATSAVDPALDVALRQAIGRLTEGRTSVTIAHRLSTAEAADEVLVFDQGRLVERGPHRQLLASGGVYADLYSDWSTGTRTI